ncbi:MAG: hypothetical protein HKO66_07625 [Saprospiraceae bacterium]|nr:DUF1801 domain-containing protein [Bacteroidia bacterium]NNL92084.1 hypothetical protein [Saprospiraceae bacterium]
MTHRVKVKSLLHLYELISEHERILLDVLRQIIIDRLPDYCKEKIAYNVPYFYANKGICLLWPSGIPRGGIDSGVLLGFWNGNLLKDEDNYLIRGSNKKIFYQIYNKPEEINIDAVNKLLDEAIDLDKSFIKKK